VAKEPEKNTISVTVGTPKGAFDADFQKTAKVSDVINAAITKKGLAGAATEFEVYLGDTLLTPTDRTLISFHVKDGDTLLVAAQGQGV